MKQNHNLIAKTTTASFLSWNIWVSMKDRLASVVQSSNGYYDSALSFLFTCACETDKTTNNDDYHSNSSS